MTRALRLRREPLAALTGEELSGVAGGTAPTFECTGTGCPPWAFETIPLKACLSIVTDE